MKKIIYLIGLVTFLSAEPSAFLAGDLDSDNPYGLTKDEKYIWQNKQDIKELKKLIKSQQKIIAQQAATIQQLKLQMLNYKMKVDTLSQQLSGIQTILPVLDQNNVELQNLKQDLNNTNTILFALKDEVTTLKNQVDTNQKVNAENIKNILKLIDKLAKNLKPKQTDFTTLPNNKIFDKALYYFKKGKYKQAREMFEYLYAKKYKPATTLFYLGEIRYKQGYYKLALGYYKKSIQTYPKPTKFTPELLYHTGYSFERLGNKEAAKKSYLKIINDFPKSIFVKYAKKRLQNLENNK